MLLSFLSKTLEAVPQLTAPCSSGDVRERGLYGAPWLGRLRSSSALLASGHFVSGAVPKLSVGSSSTAHAMFPSEAEAARHDTPEGCSGPSAPAPEKNSNDASEAVDSTPLEYAPRASGAIRGDIQCLDEGQRRERQERKRVASDLQNAPRRHKRLKHRSQLLSTEELGGVCALRDQKEVAQTATQQKVEAKTEHASPEASAFEWSEHTT